MQISTIFKTCVLTVYDPLFHRNCSWKQLENPFRGSTNPVVRNRLISAAVAIVTSDEIDQSQQPITKSVFCSIIILWISICAPCLSTSLEKLLLCYHTNLRIQSICGLLVFDSLWSRLHRSMCSLTTAAARWKIIKFHICRCRKCKQHLQRIDVDTVLLFFLRLKGLNWWSCQNEVIMRYCHFFIQRCLVCICVLAIIYLLVSLFREEFERFIKRTTHRSHLVINHAKVTAWNVCACISQVQL